MNQFISEKIAPDC